ncbi:hypothetical protein V502_10950 [Pseudogymnoascus sp. VKM F-4520 (FW-2644)]|nr:hypothetical protein V502_10950 [Pseudogymnoascus sp. VKM F-4520 (FW-2644)]
MSGPTTPHTTATDEKVWALDQATHVETIDDHSNDEDPTNFSWDYDVITNLSALYCCYFSSAWAMGVPSSSLAYIMMEYPTSGYTTTTWIAAAPSLVLCALSIFLGDMSDILGRRWFLLTGMASGVTGMLLGGLASSVEMIIAGQVLNGIGLTLGFLSTPLLAEMVPKRWRGPILSGGTLLAGLVGIGGQLSQAAFMKYAIGGLHKGWRIGFYIGAVWFFLALVMTAIFYHPGPRPNPEGKSVPALLLKIDWLGVFLGTAGLLLFLLGLQYGGNPYLWTSARVLSMIIIGLLVIFALVGWEYKGAKEGLFPRALFEHRNFGIGLGLNFIEGMVIFGAQAFTTQILTNFVTEDLVLTGVYNVPSNVSTAVGAVIAGAVATKTKESKWVALGGVLCLGSGACLLAIMRPGINLAAWFIPNIFMGLGIGGLGTIIPVITSLCTPNRYIATAVSIGTSLRGLGGSIGLVIFTQIFSSKIATFMPAEIAKATIAAGLPLTSVPDLLLAVGSGDPAAIQQVPGVTPQIMQAMSMGMKEAYAKSFRFIWFSLIPFVVLTLAGCACLKSTKKQMTLQVASAVDNRHGQRHESSGKLDEEK